MAIKLPNINVKFRQLVSSAMARGSRGVAVLIVKDSTDTSISYLKFKEISEIDVYKDKFTSENITFMKDVLIFGVKELIVARVDSPTVNLEENGNAKKVKSSSGVSLSNAFEMITSITKTGWITIAKGTTEEYTALASFIKARELEGKTYKAVVYKGTTLDNKHIVNFVNDKVTFVDDRGEKTGDYYLSSLVGILASCNIKRSSTYFDCSNLTSCSNISDKDTTLNEGKLFLFVDESKVKVSAGVNSLTTTNGLDLTEDMRYIEVVEVMDAIADDICEVFKNEYTGKYKNNYTNQLLFISSVNAYLKELAGEYVLDPSYNNICDIDVKEQAKALQSVGINTDDWDESKIKATTFKRSVFLKIDLKIAQCMENLSVNVNLF